MTSLWHHNLTASKSQWPCWKICQDHSANAPPMETPAPTAPNESLGKEATASLPGRWSSLSPSVYYRLQSSALMGLCLGENKEQIGRVNEQAAWHVHWPMDRFCLPSYLQKRTPCEIVLRQSRTGFPPRACNRPASTSPPTQESVGVRRNAPPQFQQQGALPAWTGP